MKRKRPSEEQIISILREHEARRDGGSVPQARHVERELLCLEGEVRQNAIHRAHSPSNHIYFLNIRSGCWPS